MKNSRPVFRIHYAKKYQLMGAKYEGHYCMARTWPRKGTRPFNVLCQFKGGMLQMIPYGNLKKVGEIGR